MSALETTGQDLSPISGYEDARVAGSVIYYEDRNAASCVEPGSKAYLYFIGFDVPVDEIAAIRGRYLQAETAEQSRDRREPEPVEAVAYRIRPFDDYLPEVTLTNRGASDARIRRVGVFMLSAEGRVVGYESITGSHNVLGPGETRSIPVDDPVIFGPDNVRFKDFRGAVTTVRVVVSHGPAGDS